MLPLNSVYISGITGFVGQNLKDYLSNIQVHSLPRDLDSALTNNEVQLHGTVIHLAGKAHDLRKASNPQEYYRVNFELTKKLYDAFLASEAKKFIFISSVKAAADTVKGTLTEEVTPDPKTDYGKSKVLAEQYIQNQPLPEGKAYYILRPCMIHGPGNKGNLNLLFNFVKKGIPYPLARFKNQRSFLSVENLCFIINELIQRSDVPSGVYQVADDEPLSTNEVISILSASINKRPKLWEVPVGMVTLLAKVGDLLDLSITSERLDKLTESYVVSNDKIQKMIGKKLPVTSREGLLKTISMFKSR
ncbi:NAD-dependent epimerase/dehydratase family protein [Mucilaginibacter ginkgonis]|uniref:NAD-dependent epimerase/dehydratase family protein n=1 Tax=Mucilaginibacter ginkgonis TaxID=2682091 RepID=A0A6I4I1T5_9SPHI|nr:NAD-dependent epimerase/dehydratase family protein [Mucilaginibacter ginkgonis]QQL50860.1 NAD-dependent epimerase/dehydratase family protein [Mucilaginibacter ginkgonis]